MDKRIDPLPIVIKILKFDDHILENSIIEGENNI